MEQSLQAERRLGSRPQGPLTTDRGEGPAGGVPACINWMVLLIVVMAGKVSEWVPGLSHIPLAKIAFLLVLYSGLRSRFGGAPFRISSLKVVRPAFCFMALGILSLTFSIYKSATLVASEVLAILLVSMIMLLKITRTMRDVERLLLGFCLASVSLSAGVVLNYHGGRADINDNFDPNDIAYVLDTTLPLVLALRPERSKKAWWLLGGLAVVIVVAVLLTGSRGGLLGLCTVGLLVLVFPLSSGRDNRPKSFSLKRTMISAAVLVAAVALAWGTLPATTRQRAASLLQLQNDYNASSTLNSSRTVIWRRDIKLALDRPIGFGLGTAEAVDGLHGGQYRTAHNSLVEAFVELGALGLAFYLYSYFSAWAGLKRVATAGTSSSASDRQKRMALYARGLSISLAANMTAGFFLSQAYSAALWLELAVIAALIRIALVDNRPVASKFHRQFIPRSQSRMARS